MCQRRTQSVEILAQPYPEICPDALDETDQMPHMQIYAHVRVRLSNGRSVVMQLDMHLA